MPEQNKKALILVADDQDDVAASIAEVIELSTRWRAVSAKDGKTALRLALQERPDAALLDLDMPHLGGVEVAVALRSAIPRPAPLLIGVTAGPIDAVATDVFDAVLRKPLDFALLFQMLRRLAAA